MGFALLLQQREMRGTNPQGRHGARRPYPTRPPAPWSPKADWKEEAWKQAHRPSIYVYQASQATGAVSWGRDLHARDASAWQPGLVSVQGPVAARLENLRGSRAAPPRALPAETDRAGCAVCVCFPQRCGCTGEYSPGAPQEATAGPLPESLPPWPWLFGSPSWVLPCRCAAEEIRGRSSRPAWTDPNPQPRRPHRAPRAWIPAWLFLTFQPFP